MGESPKALMKEEGKMSEEGKCRKNTGRVGKSTDQFCQIVYGPLLQAPQLIALICLITVP